MKGEKFLGDQFNLHSSHETDRAVEHARGIEGKTVQETKEGRVETYLERIERLMDNPKAARRLERMLGKDYVLDTTDEERMMKLAKDLDESEKEIAIQRGQGGDPERLDDSDIEILAKYRESIEEKQQIQKETLASWLTYLKANDADYPIWFRYYIIRSLKSIGQFDRGKKVDEQTTASPSYASRTDTTIAPFPEMNAEALGFVYKALQKQAEIEAIQLLQEERTDNKKQNKQFLQEKKQSLRNEYVSSLDLDQERAKDLSKELASRLESKNFAKLYSFAQVETKGSLNRESLEGGWVKYDQGSDYAVLEQGLKGKGTGWCTAEGSAKGQLEKGDFYVFFTEGTNGNFTEPRIAIWMKNDSVAEVRGVDPGQELESKLLDTAKQKYKDFPGAEKYEKADHDMKLMTEIYNKSFKVDPKTKDKTYLNPDLSKEELKFLYELDSKIESFGYDTDPRINELQSYRDIKTDIGLVLGLSPEQISTTKKEVLDPNKDIKYHHGDLDLGSVTSLDGVTFSEVGGYLNLNSVTSLDGVTFSEVGGDLDLSSVTSLDGVTFSEVGGYLALSSVTSLDGVTFSEVRGALYLNSITSLDGVTFSEVGGDLDLDSVTSLDGVTFSEVGGYLNLDSITSLDGVTFSEVRGALYLNSITSLDGVTLPKVGGNLNLHSVTSLDGVTFSEVGGNIYLNDLNYKEKDIIRKDYPNLTIV